jgi:hypothetical protein
MLNNKDEYLIIDSDMFLIDYFDIEKYREYVCAIVLQNRPEPKINYIWNGLFYFNLHKMETPEIINWDQLFKSDVGGLTHSWLSKQSSTLPHVMDIRNSDKNKFNKDGIYFIKHLWSLTWNNSEMPDKLKGSNLEKFIKNDPRNQNGGYFCEIYDDIFLHYRAGGDWQRKGMEFHKELTNNLKDILLQ